MGQSRAPVAETSMVAQPSTAQLVALADNEGQGESDRHKSNRERLVDLEAQLTRLDEKVTKVSAHEQRIAMLEATLTQLVESVTELQDNTKETVYHLKEQTVELFARVGLLTRAMGNAPPAPQACPQRKSLNAVQTKEPESDEEEEAAETGSIWMGALRLLNALKGQVGEREKTPLPKESKHSELMYVDIKLNGKTTRAMVDTGATHNFITTGEAERLGLTLSKDGSRMKAVNSKAQPIAGLAKETARGVPMPFLDALCMMGDESPCVVPVVRKTTDARQISALQLKKGVKRGELTYVAALKLETRSGDETPTPPVVAKLLKEFKDVMPPELPKSLPPRRAVDHRVELEPGTRPRLALPISAAMHGLSALNKATIKNKYPIPLITDLFDQLGKARYFSKLDLPSGYWQVRIAEGDEAKTTCVTSKTLEEHVEHLCIVFRTLKEHSLYVKKDKCYFTQKEIMFLGHRVGGGLIGMDEEKIRAIKEWRAPTRITELRSFLGLVNYYRRFISSYSRRAAPLTNLLRKDRTWRWSDECQKAFDDLKAARSSATNKSPFEIITDQQPSTPHTLAIGYTGSSPSAYHLAKEWHHALRHEEDRIREYQ
uniref:Reverse transcriptase/retrotransposon-derived protein RNase H-like domain-containing protein n=1 Tax=Ananas comosus var. bracteatus TaxID=296719 RepID=A0A6V7Q3F1_ANACO|nr:unnamed protein product [Ananas comosus var. bracteatus]